MTRSTLRNRRQRRHLFVVPAWRCCSLSRSTIFRWIVCWMHAALTVLIAVRCCDLFRVWACWQHVMMEYVTCFQSDCVDDVGEMTFVTAILLRWHDYLQLDGLPIKNCQFTATVTSLDYFHVTVWRHSLYTRIQHATCDKLCSHIT